MFFPFCGDSEEMWVAENSFVEGKGTYARQKNFQTDSFLSNKLLGLYDT